jgi:hypothetical protein
MKWSTSYCSDGAGAGFCHPPLIHGASVNLGACVKYANWNDCVTRPAMRTDDIPVDWSRAAMPVPPDGRPLRSPVEVEPVDSMEAVLLRCPALSPYRSAGSRRLPCFALLSSVSRLIFTHFLDDEDEVGQENMDMDCAAQLRRLRLFIHDDETIHEPNIEFGLRALDHACPETVHSGGRAVTKLLRSPRVLNNVTTKTCARGSRDAFNST